MKKDALRNHKSEYIFIIYSIDQEDLVELVEANITENWHEAVPSDIHTELTELGFELTGTDGLYKLPHNTSKNQAFNTLVSSGYRWGRDESKSLAKTNKFMSVYYKS